MRLKNWKYSIVLLLFLASLASSLIISLVPLPLICSPSEGCNVVQTSPYAFTFGVSNDYFGDVIFLAMSILTISYILKPTKGKKLLIDLGIYFGTLVAIYFLYLQTFVIHAFCKYCLVVDISMLILFALTFVKQKEKPSTIKIEEPSIEGGKEKVELSLED